MSYILEALRRAENERERKRRVPGLHTQPVPAPAADDAHPRGGRGWLWALGGAVVAVALLPTLWRWWSHDPAVEAALDARTAVAGQVTPHNTGATPDAASAPSTAAAPAAATPAAPAPAATPAPPATEAPKAPAASHDKSRTPAHTPAKTAAAHKAASGAKSEPVATPRDGTSATQAAGALPAAGRASAPQAPAPASAPEPRLRTLAELPEDLRRSVPTLAFGGSVYSEIAAQRMVILNGQVLREGDAVTDDVQIDQIRPRSAVMRVRGQRFEMPF
jgi:general secretion pathway protein B